MALHPKYCLNFGLGVVHHFNKIVNTYHPQLNGVLAGYGKLQLKKPTGAIINEEAPIHVDVVSDFWVFRPLIGRQIKGRVTKKSPTHVHVLVHGIFSIPCHKPPHMKQKWCGEKAKLKQTVYVTVLKTDFSQKVPFIQGDLQDIGLDGSSAKNVTIEETVPSPPVVEYSDEEEWNSVVEKSRKRALDSPSPDLMSNSSDSEPTKAKKPVNSSDDSSSDDDEVDGKNEKSEAPPPPQPSSPKKSPKKKEVAKPSTPKTEASKPATQKGFQCRYINAPFNLVQSVEKRESNSQQKKIRETNCLVTSS